MDFALERARSDILTPTVGLITEREQSETIITECRADTLFLARAAPRNLRRVLKAAGKLGSNSINFTRKLGQFFKIECASQTVAE